MGCGLWGSPPVPRRPLPPVKCGRSSPIGRWALRSVGYSAGLGPGGRGVSGGRGLQGLIRGAKTNGRTAGRLGPISAPAGQGLLSVTGQPPSVDHQPPSVKVG